MSLSNTEKHVKDIRRKTRRKFSSEEKIRIVLDVLRGEYSISELCRREGINNNLYYRWSKGFLEDALKVTGLKHARVHHKPRLLSDNGPCYISGELKRWLNDHEIEHTRGAPYHPMTHR